MVFEDFNQVAVRAQIDMTFASVLRTVLRQDPDIIMVGEIRDTDTAENAVQAALTGHLVLSTLHTNDASSSITRLLDLGVPHFLITSTLIGILAQRLVRENCPHCLEEYEPTAEEATAMKIPLEKLKPYRFKRGKGCLHCRETGYSGRGLGAAIARGAGSAGARVVLNCRQDLRGAEALAVEIEAAGGKAVVCRADVTDPVQARQLVDEALRAF